MLLNGPEGVKAATGQMAPESDIRMAQSGFPVSDRRQSGPRQKVVHPVGL